MQEQLGKVAHSWDQQVAIGISLRSGILPNLAGHVVNAETKVIVEIRLRTRKAKRVHA